MRDQKIFDLMKFLALKGIETTIKNHRVMKSFYLDLKCESKHPIHLYFDGTLHVNGETYDDIDLNQAIDDILVNILKVFKGYYKTYKLGSEKWLELCVGMGVMQKNIKTLVEYV